MCVMVPSPDGEWVRVSDSLPEQAITDCIDMVSSMRKPDNPDDLPTTALNIVVDLSVDILSTCLDFVRRH